jgi:hypothetical protein
LLLCLVEILQDCENLCQGKIAADLFIVSSGFKISGPRQRLIVGKILVFDWWRKSWSEWENQNTVQMVRGATRFPNAPRARLVKRDKMFLFVDARLEFFDREIASVNGCSLTGRSHLSTSVSPLVPNQEDDLLLNIFPLRNQSFFEKIQQPCCIKRDC